MSLFRRRRGRDEFTGHLPESADPMGGPAEPSRPEPAEPDVTYLLIGQLVSGSSTADETLLLDGTTVLHEPGGFRRLYRFFSRPRTGTEAADFLWSNGLDPGVLDVLVDRGRLRRLSGGTAAEQVACLAGLHLYGRVSGPDDVRVGDTGVTIAVPSGSGVRRTRVTVRSLTGYVLLRAPNHVDVPAALRMAVERGEVPADRAAAGFLTDLPGVLETGIGFLGPVSESTNFERSPGEGRGSLRDLLTGGGLSGVHPARAPGPRGSARPSTGRPVAHRGTDHRTAAATWVSTGPVDPLDPVGPTERIGPTDRGWQNAGPRG